MPRRRENDKNVRGLNEQLLANILKSNRRKRIAARISAVLALVVSSVTMLEMMHPAETLAEPAAVLQCSFAPHQHDETCYRIEEMYDEAGNYIGEEKVLVCGRADYAVHTHTDECYEIGLDGEPILVCTLPEIEEHIHTDECYEEVRHLICGLEDSIGHVHDEGCYEKVQTLACGLKEHTHTAECYADVVTGTESVTVCGCEEGAEISPAVTGTDEAGNEIVLQEAQYHRHDESCLAEREITERQLVCGLEEHTHNEKCYEESLNLICTIPEGEGAHTHTDECFETERILACGEIELHTHTAECYLKDEDEKVDHFGDPEYLICGKLELLKHVHTDECFAAQDYQDVIGENSESGTEVIDDYLTADGERTADGDKPITTLVNVDGADYLLTLDYMNSVFPENTEFRAYSPDEYSSDYLTYADQAIDEAARMSGREADELRILGMFDLSAYDENGTTVQPDGTVSVNAGIDATSDFYEDIYAIHFAGSSLEHSGGTPVQVQVPQTKQKLSLKKAAAEPASASVKAGSIGTLSVSDTEDVQTQVLEARADRDGVKFDTTGFSVYVIVGTTIEKTVTAGGYNYRITATYGADTGIPADADLSVEEITEDSSVYDAYVAYTEKTLGWNEGTAGYIRLFDIKIVDKADYRINYQPETGTAVDISIELTDKDTSEEAAESTRVVHFSNENAIGDVIENSTDGQIVSFAADGFSIYAITDSSKRLQYNFYDGTNLLVSEYIKKQDNVLQELYDPGVEPEYGQTFVGWAYTPGETNPSNIYTIEELNRQAVDRYNSAAEELTEINVYAIYDEAWYLRYMDQDAQGNAVVLNVVRVRKDAADKNVTIDYTFTPEEGIVFEGWTDVATGQTYQQGNTITLDHHVDLYVKLQGRNWLVFDSNAGGPGSGATYIPPQLLIGNDATTERPQDPVRRGYTFTGWNSKADGTGTWWYKSDGSVNRFGNTLSTDTTLYAQWEANDTDYYVVFWKQKATDAAGLSDGAKEYDYVSSERRTAKTGASVSTTNADKQKGGAANREYGYYFTYNDNNSDTTATVDANGTTVLNVYYDRREITYNFTSNTNFTVPSYTGVVDGETVVLTPDGNGGYTYQRTVTETANLPYSGTRYNISTNDNDNDPQKYIVNNGSVTRVYYARTDRWSDYHWYTTNNPNWFSTTYDNSTRYIVSNTGTYGLVDGQMITLNSDGTYTTTTTTTVAEPYTGEVTVSTTQTRSASFTGLYGSTFSNWPDPGAGRVWQSTYNNRTLSLPMALTLFDPQAALAPSAAQTTVNFTTSSYGSGYTMTVYTQTTDGEWVYSNDNILTTANLGNGGTWYPTETFEGFTVHSYQVGRNLNTNGTWVPVTSSGSFSYNNNVFLRYSRNQHKIHFISQGNHVTGRTEQIVNGVYYGSDLSKYSSGGSDYYEPTNGNEGYYFAGWYVDAECQIPFDFNTTMPDSDITVYAKWDTYRVRVVLVPTPDNAHNDEVEFANNQALSFRLDYNETVSDANIGTSVAKRPGYKLIGWYYSPDFDPATEIHFPAVINKDTPGVDMSYQSGEDWNKYGDNDGNHDNVRGILKLYAKWELDVDENSVYVEYDVDDVYRTYDTAGMLQTTIPVDEDKYALTNNAVTFQVAEAPTEYTSGFEFYRWVLLNPDGSESDILYNPSDMAVDVPSSFIYEETITDDLGNTATIKKIRLKAKFNIETEKVTTVTFDGNGGVTNDSAGQERVTESFPINKDFTMKDADSFVREGYTLIGWAFQREDGSKITDEEYKNAIATKTPDELIQSGIYQLGQPVAADNLEVSNENNWEPLENTVFAVWEINKYTVTVKKVVDGDAADTSFPFTAAASSDYELSDEDASFSLIDGGEKTFPEVPYGALLTFTESSVPGFSIQSVTAEQTTDSAGTALEESEYIQLSAVDGEPLTIKGDTVITYVNEKTKEQRLRIKKLGNDAPDGLAGAVFDLTAGEGVEDFTDLTGRTSMDGSPGSAALGYLPGNDTADSTLFALPVGSYTLTETAAPQGYIGLTEGVTITAGANGITVGDNANVSLSEPDSDGVYTLTVMNIRTIDITLTKQWYAVPNTAPVQVQLYSTYDGDPGDPELVGTYTLNDDGNWSKTVEGLPAQIMADGTLKALKYYIVETGIITDTKAQTVTPLTAFVGLENRYKAVPEGGTLPDHTINGYNSMSAAAANETLTGSGTLVVGNRALASQFAVHKKWYQLNNGYGWDDITSSVSNLYITGELYRRVTWYVGTEQHIEDQKVATVKYSKAGVVSCGSATGENISGVAETSWLLKFQETGVGNDGHPQMPTRGLWTKDGVTYPAAYTYYFRETKLEESTDGNNFTDVTEQWFRAYKDEGSQTELFNYRKSDLTIQKRWMPDASAGAGIQAVYFTVTDSAKENIGQLAYENPKRYGLTAGDVEKITLDSTDYYVVKLSPGADGWTGSEELVIAGLTTSRPLVDNKGEISADSWPEVTYTVTEIAYKDASGVHAISDLTRPQYQTQVRKYNNGVWSDVGTAASGLQLGFNGDTKVRVSNTTEFDVNILKTGEDTSHGLSGAHFALYGSSYYEEDGVTINPQAQPVNKTDIVSGSDGKAALGSLAAGTYYLVETQAPAGYNPLTRPVTIVVSPAATISKTVGEGTGAVSYPLHVTYHYYLAGGAEAGLSSSYDGIAVEKKTEGDVVSYSYTLTVPNTSGVELPSTGGSGTRLFSMIGAMLMALAGTVLAMRKIRA